LNSLRKLLQNEKPRQVKEEIDMSAILKFVPSLKRKSALSQALYERIREQARVPVFYERLAVPDTIDGRFELVVLHMCIIIGALKGLEGKGEKLSQDLFDVAFKDFDHAIREMGIGDLSVARHMKRMMEGFHGRYFAYEQALGHKNDRLNALSSALTKNLYGTVAPPETKVLETMSEYIISSVEGIDAKAVFENSFTFPEIEI
jgi:cytochrome b pre-mRNA-processing protein 3